jgi:hypothetical protein
MVHSRDTTVEWAHIQPKPFGLVRGSIVYCGVEHRRELRLWKLWLHAVRAPKIEKRGLTEIGG